MEDINDLFKTILGRISNKDNKLVFLPLHELQPYYWNLEHK